MSNQTATATPRTLTADETARADAAIESLFESIFKSYSCGYVNYAVDCTTVYPEGEAGYYVEVQVCAEYEDDCGAGAEQFYLDVALTGEFKLPEGHKGPQALLDEAMESAAADAEADAYTRRAEGGFGYCGGW